MNSIGLLQSNESKSLWHILAFIDMKKNFERMKKKGYEQRDRW